MGGKDGGEVGRRPKTAGGRTGAEEERGGKGLMLQEAGTTMGGGGEAGGQAEAGKMHASLTACPYCPPTCPTA